MKRILIALILSVSALAAVRAQQTATVGAEYPWRLQVDLTYASGALSAAPVTQFYRSDVTLNGAVIAEAPSAMPTLSLDLVAHGADTVSVTINGTPTTLTVANLVAGLQAYLAAQRTSELAGSQSARARAKPAPKAPPPVDTMDVPAK